MRKINIINTSYETDGCCELAKKMYLIDQMFLFAVFGFRFNQSFLIFLGCKINCEVAVVKDGLSVATLESFHFYLCWTNKTTYQAVHSNSCGQIFGSR